MAYSYVTYTGNGSTTQFSVPFGYIRREHVFVNVNQVSQSYTWVNASTVQLATAPANGANVEVRRSTPAASPLVDFTDGSTPVAADFDTSNLQHLYLEQELQDNQQQTVSVDPATGLPSLSGNRLTNVGDPVVAQDAATKAYVDGFVSQTANIADGAVTTAKVADGAITSAKIADGTIAAADLASNSVTTAKIVDANVTEAKLATDSVTTAKVAASAITTAKIADSNVTTAKIADGNVTTAKVADSAITSAKIADGTIATVDLADGSVTTAKVADANITTAKIADANVTTAKIADANVTTAKIADQNVTTGKVADLGITEAKLAAAAVTTAKIADLNVTTGKLADADLRTLADVQAGVATALTTLTSTEVGKLSGLTATTAELNKLNGVTANTSEINKLAGLTASTSELNQLTGKTVSGTFTPGNANDIPTSTAINSWVSNLINALGGFVAIANRNSFPTENPDPSDNAGTVVSIADAGGLVVDGSGVATNGQTLHGVAVTITGFPAVYQSATVAAGVGIQVQTTTTLNTYTFHKSIPTDADIVQLNDDINNFFARYRYGPTNPTTDLDAGDLFFNTTVGKMLVYNGLTSAWEEVQSIGNFTINTLSSSAGTGGGSASFNGTAYRFTLSSPPLLAQQLLVSINGVVQKPNSGTAQPAEGFAIDGNDIVFSQAPAASSPFFIVTMGSTVNIGTPSDGTVSTAKLVDGSVTTAKLASGSVTAAKLANSGVTAGSYGASTAVPVLTVNAQGQITAASTASLPSGIVTTADTGTVTSAMIADGTIVNADINAAAAIAGTKVNPDFGSQNVTTTGSVNGTSLKGQSAEFNTLVSTNGTRVIPSPSAGLTFYIADSGDDTTGDGSTGSPWRSLQKAFDSIPKLLFNGVQIRVKGSSYTMNQSATLSYLGVAGGGYWGGGGRVEIVSDSSAIAFNLFSGANQYGIAFESVKPAIYIGNLNFVQGSTANAGGLNFRLCELVRVDSSCSFAYNKQNSGSFSVSISVSGCTNFAWLAPVTVASTATPGYGAPISINESYGYWGASITRSGTQFGQAAIAFCNGGTVSFSGTVTNFNTGLRIGINHYGAETGSRAILNGFGATNCTEGVAVYMGGYFTPYSITFASCTRNIAYYNSSGANNVYGGQDATGIFGYNTSVSGTYRLQVNSQIYATSATIATSDGRYKEQVQPITDGISIVKRLNPVEFKWKEHPTHNFDLANKTVGFIAQEVQEALAGKPYVNSIVKSNWLVVEDPDIETVEIEPPSEAVFDEHGNVIAPARPGVYETVEVRPAVKEEFLGIAEGNITALLTAALKEAVAKIEALEARVAALEGA